MLREKSHLRWTNFWGADQSLIQELWGEADIASQLVETATAQTLMEALGNTIGNRMGDSQFPVHSSWQAVIQSGEFDGFNRPDAQLITTGVAPELNAAARVFSQAPPIASVNNAQCFFSPDAAGWQAIQEAQARGDTSVPTVAHDPRCYAPNLRQFIIKNSTGVYPPGQAKAGIPFFIFVQQKAASDVAVRSID